MKIHIKTYTKYEINGSSKTDESSTDTTSDTQHHDVMFATIVWFYLTLIALPFVLFYLGTNTYDINNLKLNELGDYLAGVAAPIAFLWLIMGYFQQSKQLKINNDLLQLQQIDLKESVIAQTEQADSMKKQLNLVIRDKYYPKFELISFEKFEDQIDIVFQNTANPVFGIDIQVLSNNMAVMGTYELNSTDVGVTLQFIEEYMQEKDFDIDLKISFRLEISGKISICYQLVYRKFAQGPEQQLPKFSIIDCKD